MKYNDINIQRDNIVADRPLNTMDHIDIEERPKSLIG